MNKYLSILVISIQQEFAYKLSFLMWRLRNVMQVLVFFFLWDAAFSNNNDLFGYSKDKILTYAFFLILLRAIVFSSRSVDISGHIGSGEIMNFLIKPISFIRYWMTRDIASKVLNIGFSIVEISILIYFLKPNIFLQDNMFYVFMFLISLIIATFLFFNILLMTNFIPFWVPEVTWGGQFLVIGIIVEFFSGASLPLDILPEQVLNILKITPFPYLIFIPIKIYLGLLSQAEVFNSILIGLIWSFILWILMKKSFAKGLYIYEANGK